MQAYPSILKITFPIFLRRKWYFWRIRVLNAPVFPEEKSTTPDSLPELVSSVPSDDEDEPPQEREDAEEYNNDVLALANEYKRWHTAMHTIRFAIW